MIDISFEINGKKVNPNSFGNAIEQAMLSEITNSVNKSLYSVSCPTHHQKPKVLIKGKNLNNLSFEISGCCDELIQKSVAKLT